MTFEEEFLEAGVNVSLIIDSKTYNNLLPMSLFRNANETLNPHQNRFFKTGEHK